MADIYDQFLDAPDDQPLGMPEADIYDSFLDAPDEEPAKFTQPFQVLAEDLMSQMAPAPTALQNAPFMARHPNIYAIGKTLEAIPETIAHGMTLGLSSRAKEVAHIAATGEALPEGQRYESIPSRTVGELVGATVPISAAGKMIAAPIIKAVSKSKNFAPFARMIGWGVAGSAYETAESMVSEGELPTPEDIVKHGAVWAAFEGALSSLGWAGRMALGVNRLAKTWGIPRKEVLKIVTAEAKKRGMPIARYAYAKAGVQKALGEAEKKSAQEFVEGVEKLFEKRGTYADLTRQLADQEVSSRIKAFKSFAGSGKIIGEKPPKPKKIITKEPSEIERILQKTGAQRTAKERLILKDKMSGLVTPDEKPVKPTKLFPPKKIEPIPGLVPPVKDEPAEALAHRLKAKVKELPPGQGFTIKPVTKLKKATRPTEISILHKPTVVKTGKPYQTLQTAANAFKHKGLDSKQYQIIKYKEGYAIQKLGRTVKPEPMEKRGTTLGFGPAGELQNVYENLVKKIKSGKRGLTQEAFDFHKVATPKQLSDLNALKGIAISKAKKYREDGDFETAMKAATEAQFYQEAIKGKPIKAKLERPSDSVTLGFGPAGELQSMYGKLFPKKLKPKIAKSIPVAPVAPASKTIPKAILKAQSPAVQKVIAALKRAKPIREQQEAIYSKERGQRLARLKAVGEKIKGEKGYYAELSQLKGKLTKVQFESIRKEISQKDIDVLFNQVKDSPLLSEWEKLPARKGLAKLFGEYGGTVPTKNEIGLLREVFGDDLVKAVFKQRTLWQKIKKAGFHVANIPRSLMASFDLSAPLRQGIFLIGRQKQWAPAFRDMFKYFGSEKAYHGLMQNIKANPNYKKMVDHKLSLTDLGSNLTSREESFMSNWAEKLPIIGIGVRASSRAYTGFLNQLRANVFDDFVKKGASLGIKDPKFLKDAAKFINAATGRGSLGSLESAAVPLNTFFFSPRLTMSRLQLINPAFYVNLQPEVRKEALKSLFTFASIASTVAGLASLNGAKVGVDPRNADFMKLKFGNTRYDILGGFQQPIRLASQLISGEIISSTTGKTLTLGEGYKPITRLGIIGRYLEYKEAPLVSFATSLLKGQTALGEKVDIPTEMVNRFVPMVVQDMIDLYNEKGLEGIPMSTPAFFGVGSQTYGGVQSYGLDGKNYQKLNNELLRLKIGMGFPGTSAYGIELTNEEYKRFKSQSGKAIATSLTKIISLSKYKNITDINKIKVIEKTVDKVKQETKEKMFSKKRVLSALRKKMQKTKSIGDKEALVIAEKVLDKYIKNKRK